MSAFLVPHQKLHHVAVVGVARCEQGLLLKAASAALWLCSHHVMSLLLLNAHPHQ